MREQARLLEHVADAAALDRHVDAGACVGEDLVLELYPALLGGEQSGDEIDECGLAAAGAAEEGGYPGYRGGEGGLEREAPDGV